MCGQTGCGLPILMDSRRSWSLSPHNFNVPQLGQPLILLRTSTAVIIRPMALRQASLLGSRTGEALRRSLRDGVSQDQRRRARAKRKPPTAVGHTATTTRLFHPSAKREMLPVLGGALAVAALATGLRYLIRAGTTVRPCSFI